MFLFAANKDSERLKRWEFVYLIVSLFCILFGAVYEGFSHEVYSAYMIYAFLFPLAGGTFICFLMDVSGIKLMFGKVTFNIYNSGIAALTAGSIFQGVLEIYGTSNGLTAVYWIAGISLVCIGIVLYLTASLYINNHR